MKTFDLSFVGLFSMPIVFLSMAKSIFFVTDLAPCISFLLLII